MRKKLIDADVAWKKSRESEWVYCFKYFKEFLDELPAANPQVNCLNCCPTNYERYNYCPYCGAKLRNTK